MPFTKEELDSITASLAEAVKPQIDKAVEEIKAKGAPAETFAGRVQEVRSAHDQIDAAERGLNYARMARAVAAAKLSAAEGEPISASQWAAREFGEQHPVTKVLAAKRTRALGTDSLAAGGALVPLEQSSDLIELLRPVSVVRRLNPTILPMDSGKLTIPGLSGGATAAYVAENANATKSEQTFRDINLVAKKLVALVPISNDLIRRSSPQADVVVRDDMVAAIGTKEDATFIRGTGISDTPKGIKLFAANTTTSAGTTLANMTTDLKTLLNYLEGSDVRMLRPAWLMSPRSKNAFMTIRDGNGNFAFREEMLSGKLWGFPFGSTNNIPTNVGTGAQSELYLADMADVVIGETAGLLIDSSMEAAYHDGSAVQAAFSRDQTVIRAITEHDVALRHLASAAYLTAVDY